MNRLLLFLLLFAFSCATPYKLPEYIKQERQRHLNTPKEYNQPPIQLDPIELMPDTQKIKGFRSLVAQSTGNWGYKFLEIDKYEDKIRDLASRPVEVFIFDTGGGSNHPDLQAVERGGASYTGEPLLDGNGHYTHCAGTYAGSPHEGGPIGIAYGLREKGLIHIRPYKVLTNSGSGSFTGINNGLKDANQIAKELIDKGYFVIYSFSLGGGTRIISSTDALLKEAEELGVLVSVAANGNKARLGVSYPGLSRYTQGISSVNTNGQLSSFSNYGPETQFALPGSGILSTYKDGKYVKLSGTSMATPHAGAVAAVLASIFDKASAAQIIAHMKKYSTDGGESGKDDKYGYGWPKMGKLLNNPLGSPPSDEPDEPDEPDDKKPDQPQEPPQGPEVSYLFTLPRTYTTKWRTMSQSEMQNLDFTATIEIKSRSGLVPASIEATQLTENFFRSRFLIMFDGATPQDVAKWTKVFYKMINEKAGYAVDIKTMQLIFNGVKYTYDKPTSRASAKDATRKNVITGVW